MLEVYCICKVLPISMIQDFLRKDVSDLSLGYCGKCKLIEQNDDVARYAYSGENWNDNNSQSGDIELLDGIICIYKRCLEEPEIHIKNKKMPSGKRITIKKRIVHTPSIEKHVANGDIIIENKCKNEFKRVATSKVECYLANVLLVNLFEAYQRDGILPDKESFFQ